MKDYSQAGFTIQAAMVDHVKTSPPQPNLPPKIQWGKHVVMTSDVLCVPRSGRVRLEFLRCKREVEQGVDTKADPGFVLLDGRVAPLLRTWYDARFENVVEYSYEANDSTISVWNVYSVRYESGRIAEEKWTGNAGFWREELGPLDVIYHCSHGRAAPDFEALVFRLSIVPR